MNHGTDEATLAAARAGDGRAFEALVAPHRRAVLAHCYRMTASAADADDAAQETVIRAWKHLAGYEGRASLRGWLHAIATRVCLDLLAQRAGRRLPSFDDAGPSAPDGPPGAPVFDPVWVEPMADARWCDGPMDVAEGPEARCSRRESVGLAFVAALQALPANQRAALLLQEVAGWQAAEIAEALDLSVAAVNSALQRARAALDARAPRWNRKPPVPAAAEADALARYLRAWEAGDPGALAAVLREDAALAMPPVPSWYAGREAVVRFFRDVVLPMVGAVRMARVGDVNGAPALACYKRDAAGAWRADSLHVLAVEEGAVARVVAFLGEGAVVASGGAAVLAG